MFLRWARLGACLVEGNDWEDVWEDVWEDFVRGGHVWEDVFFEGVMIGRCLGGCFCKVWRQTHGNFNDSDTTRKNTKVCQFLHYYYPFFGFTSFGVDVIFVKSARVRFRIEFHILGLFLDVPIFLTMSLP
jgi:hypothetical protein